MAIPICAEYWLSLKHFGMKRDLRKALPPKPGVVRVGGHE